MLRTVVPYQQPAYNFKINRTASPGDIRKKTSFLAFLINPWIPSRDSVSKNILYGQRHMSHVTRHTWLHQSNSSNLFIYIYSWAKVNLYPSLYHWSPSTSKTRLVLSACPVIESHNNPIVRLSGYYERHPLFAPSGIPCSRSFLLHLNVCPIAGWLLNNRALITDSVSTPNSLDCMLGVFLDILETILNRAASIQK